MHALILLGSRNTEGQTASCANAIARGLADAGVTTEMIFLPTLNLERCRQCDPDGWGLCRHEGRCIIEDDFASLLEKIKSADIAVFANPVYFMDLSESLRGFLDRLRRISYERKDQSIQGKLTLGVCYAGSGGGGAPLACLRLEEILNTIGFNVVDVIPVRRQNLKKRIPILGKAGKRLGNNPNISQRNRGKRLVILTRRVIAIIAYLLYYRLRRLLII